MEALYPLIRALQVDAREIFNPEMQRQTPALQHLRLLIEDCSEEEAAVIIPVFQSVLIAFPPQIGKCIHKDFFDCLSTLIPPIET